MERKTLFRGWLLPAALVAPQLLITFVFFFWPAGQALVESTQATDAFGLSTIFVGASNFLALLADPNYHAAILRLSLIHI